MTKRTNAKVDKRSVFGLVRAIQGVACIILAAVSCFALQVDELRTHVFWMADSAREGRRSGQQGAVQTADYISAEFRRIGLDVQVQEFGTNRRNVVGRFGRSEKYVLIGAHYDGQGPEFPSASDNAAGVALLMQLGKALASANYPASVVLVAFDGEEQGLEGSKYYADHSPFPLENATAVVIMDVLGRSLMELKEPKLFVFGAEYSSELLTIAQRKANLGLLGTDLIGPRSDFVPFAQKRIPYLFFSDGTNKDYHGKGDTAERVNYRWLEEENAVMLDIIKQITLLQSPPTYRASPAFPAAEAQIIADVMAKVKSERKDLDGAYRLVLDDLQEKLATEVSRDTLRVAATTLLALSSSDAPARILAAILIPFYQKLGQPQFAETLKQEFARLSSGR